MPPAVSSPGKLQSWSPTVIVVYVGGYLLLKCGMLVERASLLLSSAKAVLWQEASYGQYAKPEEIMESGNQCSICQVVHHLTSCTVELYGCILVNHCKVAHTIQTCTAASIRMPWQAFAVLTC